MRYMALQPNLVAMVVQVVQLCDRSCTVSAWPSDCQASGDGQLVLCHGRIGFHQSFTTGGGLLVICVRAFARDFFVGTEAHKAVAIMP